MEKKQLPTYAMTPEAPIVPIGTILGQRIYVELRGYDVQSRDSAFIMTQEIFKDAFKADYYPTTRLERSDD